MDLNTHLDELDPAEAAAFHKVIGRLRSAQEQTPSTALALRIIAAAAAVRHSQMRHRAYWPWLGTAAAAAAVIVFTLLHLPHTPSAPAAPLADAALQWLASSQEADGTWSPARHGGADTYRPALTALAALALAEAADGQYAPHVRRACDALASMQSADGAFGGENRELYYNHAITTFALASLYAHTPCPRPVIERSLAFMLTRQSPEGGWDYEDGTGGNAAVTAWHVRALTCMTRQGFAEADIPLRKALRWLRGTVREDGSIAYHRGSPVRSESLNALAAYALITGGADYPQLVALGQHMAEAITTAPDPTVAADCYRDYAKVLALDAAGAAHAADKVRARMLDCGLADSRDQWHKVGGSLYTSALTSLAAH
ncbi:MAG: terpene cyclase/mutase family protein [Kiritimatiellae bacterium]|nr:terpene cyclase/mutase family protein [Kiritimatiellia bacterium]